MRLSSKVGFGETIKWSVCRQVSPKFTETYPCKCYRKTGVSESEGQAWHKKESEL